MLAPSPLVLAPVVPPPPGNPWSVAHVVGSSIRVTVTLQARSSYVQHKSNTLSYIQKYDRLAKATSIEEVNQFNK